MSYFTNVPTTKSTQPGKHDVKLFILGALLFAAIIAGIGIHASTEQTTPLHAVCWHDKDGHTWVSDGVETGAINSPTCPANTNN